MSGRPRLLVDTASLLYRAFFALPKTIRDPQGQPVNAVRGYLDMTSRVVAERRPRAVLHVLDDDWRPAPRVAAYPGYKSERAPEPPEFTGQLDLLLEVLAAAGAQVASAPGWEADDAIATLVEDATGESPDQVLTGDRDLLQLVRDPAVRLLFTRQGVTVLEEFDEAAVSAAYGVPPRLYADLAVLRGDPSDGLPGVRGIGAKGAAKLVCDHGSRPPLGDDPAGHVQVAAHRVDRLPLGVADALRQREEGAVEQARGVDEQARRRAHGCGSGTASRGSKPRHSSTGSVG